jgi:parvulin-like peptidyl-prolyl isomerase
VAYRRSLEETRLTEDEYRRVLEAGLLSDKAKEKFVADVAAGVPQAKVEVIVTSDEAAAQAAIARINAGEEWAVVARDVSTEPDVATTGGLKDFQPENASPAVYDDYAFSAPVGQISTPLVETPDSPTTRYYVVRVVERSDQPLNDGQKPNFQDREWQEWLADAQTRITIVDNWSDDFEAQNAAVTPLYEDALKKEEAQQRVTPIINTPVITTPIVNTPAAETPAAPAPTPASGQ